MTATDAAGFLPQATAIAVEAGKLLMPYFERRIKFEYKGDADLVTEADRASEQLIVSRLRTAWPDHDIVGEEGTRDTPWRRLPLVCGPARRHHQLCPRLSGFLRFHGA